MTTLVNYCLGKTFTVPSFKITIYFFFLLIYYCISYKASQPQPPLPLLPPVALPTMATSPLPQIHCSSVFLQKRARFPGIPTTAGQDAIGWSTSPHNKARWDNPVGGKGSQHEARWSEISPHPLLEVPQNPMYPEHLAQIHASCNHSAFLTFRFVGNVCSCEIMLGTCQGLFYWKADTYLARSDWQRGFYVRKKYKTYDLLS